MKKKIYSGLAAVGFLLSFSSKWVIQAIDNPAVSFNTQIANDAVLCATKTYTVDVNDRQANRLAAFIIYSTVAVPSIAFTDGRTSTAALTISSNTALSSAAATNTMTVSSNAALANKYFTLNGYVFKENVDWTSCEFFTSSRAAHSFSTATAVSIAVAVNFSSYGVTASTVASGVVRLVAREKNANGNTFTLSASTIALSISATTYFTGGRNPTIFKINGVAFEADKDYPVTAFSSRTAQNISSAIVTNPFINTLVVSTWTTNGVIWATTTFVNQSSFTLYTSSNGALTIASTTVYGIDGSTIMFFVGGSTSAINLDTDYITSTNTFAQGQAVLFSSAAGTSPAPLKSRTTYFILSPAGNQFRLAYTSTGALNGLNIDITTVTRNGGGTFTVAALGYTTTSTATFSWAVSNDQINWLPMTTTFSANFSSVTALDFSNINYRYLQLSVTASSNTPTSVNAWVNGKP